MREFLIRYIYKSGLFWPEIPEIFKKNLQYIDMSIYNNMFSNNVREDGKQLYQNSKLEVKKVDKNVYECNVNKNQVLLTFNVQDNLELDDAQCTCQDFMDTGFNCKHIYVALKEINYNYNNYEYIKSEVELAIKEYVKVSEIFINYIRDNKHIFRNNMIIQRGYQLDTIIEYKEICIKMLNNLTRGNLLNIYNSVLASFCVVGKNIVVLEADIKRIESKSIQKYLFVELNKILEEYDNSLNKLDHISSVEEKEKFSISNHDSKYIKHYDLIKLLETYNNNKIDETLDNLYYFSSDSDFDEKNDELVRLYKKIKRKEIIYKYSKVLKLIFNVLFQLIKGILMFFKSLLEIFGAIFGGENLPQRKSKKGFFEQEEERKRIMLEDEMDAYALEEHEKELVRNGLHNPWDFETEGPFEDDDYYNEDPF